MFLIRASPKIKPLDELIFGGVEPRNFVGMGFVVALFTSEICFTRNITSAKKTAVRRAEARASGYLVGFSETAPHISLGCRFLDGNRLYWYCVGQKILESKN